jgi:hypothetical protein
MERRLVLLSNAIPERPAELRPVPGLRCQGQQRGKRNGSLKKYPAIHVQGEATNLTIRPAMARLIGPRLSIVRDANKYRSVSSAA